MAEVVELTIDSSIKVGKTGSGAAGYVLSTLTDKGAATAGDRIPCKEATRNRSLAIALRDGLRRIRKPCTLVIRSKDGYIRTSCEQLRKWREQGWKTAKGEPVKNAGEWQEIETLLARHRWKVEERGSYTAWLETELKTKGENEHV